jgi:acyl carrier protein
VRPSERYQWIASLDGLTQIMEAAASAGRRDGLELATPYVRASTPIETHLVDIWKAVLRLDDIGVDDDFFALNGDSLACMHVIARVHELWNVDIPLEAFFEQPTVRQLALAIAAAREADGGRSTPAPQPTRES